MATTSQQLRVYASAWADQSGLADLPEAAVTADLHGCVR